jgi:SAM-dependent methyltransferase
MLRSLMSAGIMAGFTEITALDISSIRVGRIKAELPEIRAEVADAMRLPFPNESIDFVFSDQVIEHVVDDRGMANEIARVLKPGGVAVVGSVLRNPGAWYFYRCNGRWRLDPTHVREYESLSSYCSVFSDNELTVKDCFLQPVSFPLSDLVLRALLRLKLLREDKILHVYERFPALRTLLRGSIPIPRYFFCYAEMQKPALIVG